eukprot:g2419.t1
MQSLVSELSTTANTLDLVSSIEKAVQVVTHAKKCIVYFFDNDATEVWSYPTVSVPASYRLAFGIGLPGRIASFLKELSNVRHALSFWGSGKLEFTTQDSEFMEWLASAAGSHVERLSLDLMWTKALLERDTGDSSTMKQESLELE